jgi:hypothetical protein
MEVKLYTFLLVINCYKQWNCLFSAQTFLKINSPEIMNLRICYDSLMKVMQYIKLLTYSTAQDISLSSDSY